VGAEVPGDVPADAVEVGREHGPADPGADGHDAGGDGQPAVPGQQQHQDDGEAPAEEQGEPDDGTEHGGPPREWGGGPAAPRRGPATESRATLRSFYHPCRKSRRLSSRARIWASSSAARSRSACTVSGAAFLRKPSFWSFLQAD